MNLDATVRYLTKTGNKNRYITTYKNNVEGRALREAHKYYIDYLNTNNYENFNSDYAYAYLKNKSPKKLVIKHLNNNYFLYLDISNFFESIDLEVLKDKSKCLISKNLPEHKLNELIDSCIVPKKDNGLAIGLIPSSLFSNIYLKDFDSSINYLLQKLDTNFVYTRYSDDIVISLNNSFDYKNLLNEINNLLTPLNLSIHESKSLYKELTTRYDHIKVLGLNIIKGSKNNYITVSRKYKKKAKQVKKSNVKKGMNNYIIYNQNLNML